MADKGVMSWTNWRDKEESREFNYTLDIRNYQGMAGWAWLAIAANTHLSMADLQRLLVIVGGKRNERSLSWIQRRRWMFQPPNTLNNPGNKPNKDGRDSRALEIMRANPKLSTRQLSRLLREKGISRSSDWVRRHRGE